MTAQTASAALPESRSEAFRNALLIMLEEVFEHVHGYILDPGDSFFDTLSDVSAAEASRRLSSRCAPLSAQINHTRFYLDVLLDLMRTGERKKSDWEGSWNVGDVSEAEWQDLIDRLRSSYLAVRELAASYDHWDEDSFGGAIALASHSAYHLGEVRQALGVMRG